jgi:hypothetical protein
MWVIQGELLVRLPEGSAVPPGSIEVDPPEAFHADPRSFVVRDGKLERIKRSKRNPRLTLSQEEIGRIKKAIEAGVI